MNHYSPENIKRAMVAADSLKMYGERFNWFVGTKDSDYSFDASCCADMNVITFHPKPPSGSGLRNMKGAGLYHEPLMDSAFYADLAAKTFSAVTKMKKGAGCKRVVVKVYGVLNEMFSWKLARDDLHQVQRLPWRKTHREKSGPDVSPEGVRSGGCVGRASLCHQWRKSH